MIFAGYSLALRPVRLDLAVGPYGLFNQHLLPALAERRFEFTESHPRIFHVGSGRELRTPMVTWATRTRARRYGSVMAAAVARRLWRAAPVVRMALHPFDFDHRATVASIARTLTAFARERTVATYDDALFGAPAPRLSPSSRS